MTFGAIIKLVEKVGIMQGNEEIAKELTTFFKKYRFQVRYK